MAPAIVCLGGRGLIATSSATAARTPPVCVPLPPLPSPLSIYSSRFRFGHTLLSAYDTVQLTLKTSTSNFISLSFLLHTLTLAYLWNVHAYGLQVMEEELLTVRTDGGTAEAAR